MRRVGRTISSRARDRLFVGLPPLSPDADLLLGRFASSSQMAEFQLATVWASEGEGGLHLLIGLIGLTRRARLVLPFAHVFALMFSGLPPFVFGRQGLHEHAHHVAAEQAAQGV